MIRFCFSRSCGMKCHVTGLEQTVNNAKNLTDMQSVEGLVHAGGGVVVVNGVQVEVGCSQNVRLGQLIGMGGAGDEGGGEYEVIVGNREWMNRNGVIVGGAVDTMMKLQEEQGRSAVLCVIDGNNNL